MKTEDDGKGKVKKTRGCFLVFGALFVCFFLVSIYLPSYLSYRKQKKYEKSIEDVQTYYIRGHANYNKRRYDQAISDYKKAIELNPKFAGAYYNRGNAYDKKGQYDQAISDFNKAIEINPKYAKAYFNRGIAWRKKGDFDRACSDYQKACELGVCKGLNWAKEKGYCR